MRSAAAVRRTQGKLPAATHYRLQQHTWVVKGVRDGLHVISTSVTLWSAPVITVPFSLPARQWKPSFETRTTGHLADWALSQWTDMLSQQTWRPSSPPPLYLTVPWNRKINSSLIFSVDTAGTSVSLPSVLDISSKVVRCAPIILFVLWDGGRNVIERDAAAVPWWWDENGGIVCVWLQTAKMWKENVRPWQRLLVAGCSYAYVSVV